jgi:hypothetical protein
MAKKTTKTDTPLCVLHEVGKLKAELFRDGDTFRVHFVGAKRKDRAFDSLPNLLSGLHGIFVEIRMGSQGVRGLGELAKVSDEAREDVLAASRKIHQALGTV